MHLSASADHAGHDILLIAGHASGDLSNLDMAAAVALLQSCDACAELHRDLVAIAGATRALPRTASARRDFRITAEQAGRLGRGSWIRSVLRPFASARSATRPAAAALTSLGVAGLLVATIVPGLLGGAASAPARDGAFAAGAGGAGSTQAPAPAQEAAGATAAPEGAPAAAGASADTVGVKQAEDSGMYVAVGGQTGPTTGSSTEPAENLSGTDDANQRLTAAPPPNPLLVGSLVLLAAGLALFGLRFAARRIR